MSSPKLYKVAISCEIMVLAESEEEAINAVTKETDSNKEFWVELEDEILSHGNFSANVVSSLDEVEDSWVDHAPYNYFTDCELSCKECLTTEGVEKLAEKQQSYLEFQLSKIEYEKETGENFDQMIKRIKRI